MAKKTHAQSTKSCSDCVHEYAFRMWTDGRMISDESASRCPNHTTVKESAAYLIGKMDGEKHATPTADVAPIAEWISVEERLPDEKQKVLLYSPADGIQIGHRLDEVGRFYVSKAYPERPTHWMPLPSAPKKEKNND